MIQTEGPVSGSTATPGSLDPDEDGKVILAVSHQGCLLAIRRILIKSDFDAVSFKVDVAPGIKITDHIGNTSCIVLRIWKDEAFEKLRIRIEAWPWSRDDWTLSVPVVKAAGGQ